MPDFDEAQFTRTVIGNAFKLWFGPELDRRVAAGELPRGFKVWGAQIIIDLEQPHIINFNEQIEGVLAAHKTPGASIEVGQVVSMQDFNAIQGLTLTTQHANAAHLTVIWLKGKGYLLFDFRYNADRIGDLVRIADEFIASAHNALTNDLLHPFADSLFGAVELLAKSLLMMHPDPRFLGRHGHGFVESELHKFAKYGNVPQPYVNLHKRLTALRPAARFGRADFDLGTEEAKEMLEVAIAMRAHVEERRPTRYDMK